MNDSYLAGFIDGEGHISIRLRRRIRKGRLGKPNYDIQVQISQKTIEPLKSIQTMYGGALDLRPRANNRTAWVLVWCSHADVMRILNAIEPFVICKRRATLEAMAILKTLIASPSKYSHVHAPLAKP